MSEWVNRFRRLGTDEIVREFRCRCAPEKDEHGLMVMGAMRNMDLEKYWLDDGVQAWDSEEVAALE